MAQALKRLVTGIDGLDALLKGGLIAGASYIIQGRRGPVRPSSPISWPAATCVAVVACWWPLC